MVYHNQPTKIVQAEHNGKKITKKKLFEFFLTLLRRCLSCPSDSEGTIVQAEHNGKKNTKKKLFGFFLTLLCRY